MTNSQKSEAEKIVDLMLAKPVFGWRSNTVAFLFTLTISIFTGRICNIAPKETFVFLSLMSLAPILLLQFFLLKGTSAPVRISGIALGILLGFLVPSLARGFNGGILAVIAAILVLFYAKAREADSASVLDLLSEIRRKS